MNDAMPVLGTVVISKAGRDAGRYFVILDIADDAHVYICDGDLRKVQKPKKKKLKHLQALGYNVKEKAF